MPWNRATFSGDSSVVTTSQETRPASAEVPSGFVAMPIETPIANSSGRLSRSAPPAVLKKTPTRFASFPVAVRIQ